MDNNKKQQNYSRTGNAKTSNQTTDSNRQKTSSSDIQTTKHWPRNSRRRENPTTSSRSNNNTNNNNNKQQLSAKVRPNVDKRPRARGYNGYNNNNQNAGGAYRGTNEDYFTTGTGLGSGDPTFYDSSVRGAVGRSEQTEYEINSVYAPGSKKQNLNHLLNFYYTPREVDYYDGIGGNSNGCGNNGHIQRHGYIKKHKYNKEQFLQANFQFVIKASAKRKTDDSPDTLIDWSLIEQINIQTPDEPQCPICLYPPVAAKVTRCGHVYCWPCVLHYLSLSDKTWRKCPICYDAIHVGDLKSASIVQQQSFKVNSHITLRLMRRKKGSLYIEKHDGMKTDQTTEKYPYVCSPMEEKIFSKFILATRSDVADILAREKRELLNSVDETCPEYVFIQQALELLKERSEILGDIDHKDEGQYPVIIEGNYSENENEQSEMNEGVSLNKTQEINNEIETFDSFNTDTTDTNSVPINVQQKSSTKFYYFYQSDDGQNIYLHPLNVKMLQACYGSLADAPTIISARIIQKEQHSMDEDHRRKFTCLGHLPLTCEFAVVEIELQPPYVTEDILQAFKQDILHRKKERQRKAKEEREREKYINAINDRQMGKLIASTANINITSSHEFPTCGFEESLVPMSGNDIDVSDNVPSTSKGNRTKTVSTSSAGSCSYSAIAIHCKKEHTPWSTLNAAQITKQPTATAGDQLLSDDGGEPSILSTIQTNLGDVLAQALSQKKERKTTTKTNETNNKTNLNSNSGNKKSKKSKKMLPLYSTGMNFSGN